MSADPLSSASRSGRVFGLPLGDLGLFATLLMALAFGFLVFFAACFLGIVGLSFWNLAGHHAVNMADSYRYFALPAGLAALILAMIVLLSFWVRHRFAGRP